MSAMASLLLPGMPAGQKRRNYILRALLGLEFPSGRSVCCTAPAALSRDGGNQEDGRHPTSSARPLRVCGWCGCACGCACEGTFEACAHDDSLFEKFQPDDIPNGKTLDSEDDGCGSSVETLSVFSIESSSSSASELALESGEAGGEDSDPTLPDFSGHWVFRRYEGNFDAMMEDAGTHWTIRRLARAANYGVGMISQDVSHHGDHMVVDFNAGASVNRSEFQVGESEQVTLNEAGEECRLNAAWEGAAIFVAGVRAADGSKQQETLRYMDGHEMVVETRLRSGAVVRRFYAQ